MASTSQGVNALQTTEENANYIFNQLRQDPDLAQFVDFSFPIPKTFNGRGDIKLIILGQDPTVKNPKNRAKITTILNLDRNGHLRRYPEGVCEGLGLTLDENVFATNYFKNFFVKPPTQIEDVNIFEKFTPIWLPLLLEEIGEFPGVPVLILGEPLLSIIVKDLASPKVRDYWGYKPDWQEKGTDIFQYLKPENNTLERVVFPYPHQPSLQKKFYRNYLHDFNLFTRKTILDTASIDSIISSYQELLSSMINGHYVPFSDKTLKELPRTGGVYRIVEGSGNEDRTLYVGQSKDLRKRNYRNHFHGPNRRSTFRRKLLVSSKCQDDHQIHEYLSNECSLQYIEIEDKREKHLFEHFAIAGLRPVYND